jgi:arabinan endo-1,5-alpha-L-arabinosidase
MRRLIVVLRALVLGFALGAASGSAAEFTEFLVPVPGPSQLIFDSNPSYINDHSVIQAQDGTWHMIGITHQKMLGGRLPVPNWEDEFAHATAPTLLGPWTAQAPVLPVDWLHLENHVWAPHLVVNDGLYYCFYAAGGGHLSSMINLATSPDLARWTRSPANPLFRGFYDARDPMVLRDGDRWIIYYTKTYSTTDWTSTVAYRTSPDLLHWSEPGLALALRDRRGRLVNSGSTESPFVVKIGGLYYLFICSPDQSYRTTYVYVSAAPLHFEEADEVTELPFHCAEVVQDGDRYYLTHAGWFYDGVYLAPLTWRPARRLRPGLLLADAGKDEAYLTAGNGARKVRSGLYGGLAPAEGQGIEYTFPIPAEAAWLTLAFEAVGAFRVSAGGQVMAETVGGEETTLHVRELDDPALWRGGGLRVRLEAVAGGGKDRPALSYVKVYYR